MNAFTVSEGSREEVMAEGINEPLGHYVDAVRFGDVIYVSGCAPLDASGALVGTDATEQAEQVFANMKQVLEAADGEFANVLKVTVWLTDAEDRNAVDAVRRRYFGDARPASTLVEVAALAIDGMKVEVDAIVGCV